MTFVSVRCTIRARTLRAVVRLANWLEARWFPQKFPQAIEGGKVLGFVFTGMNLRKPVYRVVSLNGGMYMGTIEWSNQWSRPRFKAHPEAIFDQQCVAEIYAKMRDFR